MSDKILVVDTNILIKLFVNEEYSDLAVDLLKKVRSEKINLISPQFSKIEFYSIIKKKEILRQIDFEKCLEIFKMFLELKISFVKEDWDLLNESFRLAKKIDQTTIYDCVFVELARKIEADFISEDIKILKKSKSIYKNCFRLGEYLKK